MAPGGEFGSDSSNRLFYFAASNSRSACWILSIPIFPILHLHPHGRSQFHNPLGSGFCWGRLQTIPNPFGLPQGIAIIPGNALLFKRLPGGLRGVARYKERIGANGCIPSDIVTVGRSPRFIKDTTLWRAIFVFVISRNQGVISGSYSLKLRDRDGSKCQHGAVGFQPDILLIC